MANLRDILRRIKSVRNTAQITKAMQLVSSAKMKRAQNQALSGRKYIGSLAYVFANLRDSIETGMHPFLAEGAGDRSLVLVISTDKGLCGALNTNLYRRIKELDTPNTDYIAIGKKLGTILKKMGKNVIASWTIPDPVPVISLQPVFLHIRSLYLAGKYKKVSIAYSQFVNTLVQRPDICQLLPIRGEELDVLSALGSEHERPLDDFTNFTLEPDAQGVLSAILPLFVFYDILQRVLDARASEHSARMVSMKAATENAQEIIKELNLVYNKARQTAITSELTEISSAMKAME